MISGLLKSIIQNTMLSTSPKSVLSEMIFATPEDPDFTGTGPGGSSPRDRADTVLRAMRADEKLRFVTGYKSLAVPPFPRLGLPAVWMSDATSGARSYGPVTAFPAGVAMAATWNRELVARAADSIAESARAKGVSILLGPGVNIARLPTCGRNFEYMGEDPFLAGELAASYIRSCASRGVICTVKHFAVNNSEYDRHKVSSDMDERTLREIYLPAFEAAVKEARTWAVMSSYNPVNGVWAGENRHLLTEILRDEWGFDGFVVSDWNSLYSTAGPLKAGLDIEMPRAKWLTPDRIKTAIEAGSASWDDIDRMVGNILRNLFAAGVYDRPVKDSDAREFHPDHDLAALDVAREGIVLLKNDNGTLPLPEGEGITIAVCGNHSVVSETMGGGSCHISRTTGTVHLADGLRAVAAPGTRVITVGTATGRIRSRDRRILASADAVVVACGFDHISESELYDRPWRLPGSLRRLIARVSKLNRRITVVLTAGGDVETVSWMGGVGALVHGLYLGQSVGTATSEVLFGRVNPSGRLPFTMAGRWNDISATKGYPRRYWTTTPGRMTLGQGNPKFRRMRHWFYAEGLMVGYRHFDTAGIDPAFCFGHGLSYTTFTVDGLSLSKRTIGPDDHLDVSLRVANTGKRQGSEVIQIYIADPPSRLPRPAKELKGFTKVRLEAGESIVVTMRLTPAAFRYWDPQAASAGPGSGSRTGAWVSEPGEFRILAGRSSRCIDAEGTVLMTD